MQSARRGIGGKDFQLHEAAIGDDPHALAFSALERKPTDPGENGDRAIGGAADWGTAVGGSA